ncbi:hypothetical protein HGA64_00750 [Candidatus Falkowbacteria bacterium]|nr:hypothetical protein [Candidatus Falkowbacteria bacterium]
MPRRKKEETVQAVPTKEKKTVKKEKTTTVKAKVGRPRKVKPVEAKTEPVVMAEAVSIKPKEAVQAPVAPLQPQAAPAKEVLQVKENLPTQPANKQVMQPSMLKSDQEKRMIMWTGVTFFMVLIIGLWMFNLRLVFQEGQPTQASEQVDLKKVAKDFDDAMSQVRQGLDKLDASSTATTTDIFATSTATTTMESATSTGVLSTSTPLDQEVINETVKSLERQANTVATPTPELPQ